MIGEKILENHLSLCFTVYILICENSEFHTGIEKPGDLPGVSGSYSRGYVFQDIRLGGSHKWEARDENKKINVELLHAVLDLISEFNENYAMRP